MTSNTGSKRVLFVDDEPSIRLTLPPILEKAGFEVHVAESVPDALFEINSYRFDALITDLNIGEEGDGFLVASGMRHIQPHCKTFILTGYPAFETALQAIHSQVDDYLVKPVEVDSLLGMLKDKMGTHSAKSSTGSKRIPDALAEVSSQTAARILEAIKRNPPHQAGGAADAEIAAHPSIFLNALIEFMQEETSQLGSEALRTAAEHGKLRKKSGASISAIPRDFRCIEEEVYQVVQSSLTSSDLLTLVSDLRKLTLGVNLLMDQALQGFSAGAPEKSTHR